MVGWKATKLEVIQVIRYYRLELFMLSGRDVCDKLLDKSVPEKQRHVRAEAILMIGRIFRSAQRDPGQEDNGDYLFEQLLASSQKKKKKPAKSSDRGEKGNGASVK
jgi:hypothetical protein